MNDLDYCVSSSLILSYSTHAGHGEEQQLVAKRVIREIVEAGGVCVILRSIEKHVNHISDSSTTERSEVVRIFWKTITRIVVQNKADMNEVFTEKTRINVFDAGIRAMPFLSKFNDKEAIRGLFKSIFDALGIVMMYSS